MEMTWIYAGYVLAFFAVTYAVYWVRMRIVKGWLQFFFVVPVGVVGVLMVQFWFLVRKPVGCVASLARCEGLYWALAIGCGLLVGLLVAAVRSYQAEERRKAESTAGG